MHIVVLQNQQCLEDNWMSVLPSHLPATPNQLYNRTEFMLTGFFIPTPEHKPLCFPEWCRLSVCVNLAINEMSQSSLQISFGQFWKYFRWAFLWAFFIWVFLWAKAIFRYPISSWSQIKSGVHFQSFLFSFTVCRLALIFTAGGMTHAQLRHFGKL